VTLELPGFAEIASLDRGGFGSVYRATRVSTGGTVALKQLDRAGDVDEQLLERRLRREVAALVALKGHPNIVQVEEMLMADDGPIIVMEFMDSGSLASMVSPNGPDVERLAYFGSCIAAGLAAAHAVGIVHRDVKPQNVLMNGFGQVKLCDFGIAAILKSAEVQTRTTSLSVRYASPEELDDDPDVGPPTDVYSLGASLYHLLYGAPPSFRTRHQADPDATVVRRGNARVLAAVCEIVDQCLQVDPNTRPTALSVYDMLAVLSDTGPRSGARAEDLAEAETIPRDRLPAPSGLSADRSITAPRVEKPDSTSSQARAGSTLPQPAPPTTAPSSPSKSVTPNHRLPQPNNEKWWTE